VGFDQTVLPHVERALLAGHDVILLGERGQGKTRLIRTHATLLHDWSPAIAGCESSDHPYQPACSRCRRLAAELGDDLPGIWRQPLDIVLAASANLQHDTNRGRIITPLNDRFGAEVRTHYALWLNSELDLIAQQADVSWGGKDPGAVLPAHITEIISRFTRLDR